MNNLFSVPAWVVSGLNCVLMLKTSIIIGQQHWSYSLFYVNVNSVVLIHGWCHTSQGASTLYGPHTLSAYIQEFKKLATALVTSSTIEPGLQPPDLLDQQISLLPPVVLDGTPPGVKFGDLQFDVPMNSTFKRGGMVNVTFWSACPRNDLMTEGTFALVEILHGKDSWVPAYDDDDFCLRFKWSRPAKLSPRSYATIEWRIPESAAPGVYRIRHFGASKSLFGSISHFTGTSSAFVVA